jgi:hypothetical protein
MATTVTIGCRLPSGLILELAGKSPVVLAGQRQAQERSPIILLSEEDVGYTEVDADFWEAFKKLHPSDGEQAFAPLKSGAIFEAKTRNEARAKAKDLQKEKTGHEPLSQETKDIKADA